MGTNKVSTLWTNFTNDIASITVPAVAWETIAKEVYQLTPEIAGLTPEESTPATYRVWVYPVDLNDDGAAERDIAVGYGFMSWLGDVFSITAIGLDGSIDISDDALTGYCPPCGRPAMIYSSTSPIKPPPAPPVEVIDTRWIEVDLACTLDINGNNTGIQTGISKKQTLNTITGLWEDTGEQVAISRTNLTACPPQGPDPYRAGQYTGITFTPAGVTDFTFSFGVEKSLTTIPLAGRNYLFLSLPLGKTFKVIDGSGVNITSKFSDTAITDNKAGYQDNKVWVKYPPYASEDSVPFYVTIYS